MAHCENCDNKHAHHIQIKFTREGEKIEICDRCGANGNTTVPDVYFTKPHSLQNVTDRLGNQIHFNTRREKAEYFRKNGLQEMGDKYHGTTHGNTRYLTKTPDRWRHRYE